MQGKSTRWRWTIWIACFAVLMNALAPSISHAMASMNGVPATWEICRADGASLAGALVKKIGDGKDGKLTPMADCGYCLPHAGSFALMPPTIAGLGLVKGHAPRPFLFYRAPRPLLALSAAPPRGPPALA